MSKDNNPTTGDVEAVDTSTNVGGTTADPKAAKEKTKSMIAICFVFSFLGIIGLIPSVLLFCHIVKVDEYKDIVLTLAGVLGGPLGIVITNYFKDKEGES